MTWNYRVVKHTHSDGKEEWYTIHEVYYDKHGNITGYTDRATPFGDNLSELKNDLRYMRQACRQPILDIKELDAMIDASRERDWNE